jgi:hypothetical protein
MKPISAAIWISLLVCFKGVPTAVEFQTLEWYTNRVIERGKEREVSLVSLNMSELKDLPLLMDVVTTPFFSIRLLFLYANGLFSPLSRRL